MGLIRYALVLASTGVLILVAIMYLSGEVSPLLFRNVSDDGCDHIQMADGTSRADPLDPDCVYGVWGGPPEVTAEEAAAAEARWYGPDALPYFLFAGLATAVLVVAAKGPSLRARRHQTTG